MQTDLMDQLRSPHTFYGMMQREMLNWPRVQYMRCESEWYDMRR